MKRWSTLAIALAVLLFEGPFGLHRFERSLGDRLLRIDSGALADAPVAVVAIGDRSLDEIGRWPWPAERIDRLLAAVAAAEPRAVAVDLLLENPSAPPPNVPFVFGAALERDGRWWPPAKGGLHYAHVHGETDPDGVVRGFLATKEGEGLSRPALALAAAREVDPSLAIEPGRELRPDFRLSPLAVPAVEVADLLVGRGADLLRDRIVFVGLTATGASDQFVVPVVDGRPVPGVLAHAAAAEALLRGGVVSGGGLLAWFLWPLGAVLCASLLPARSGRGRGGWLVVVLLVLPLAGYAALHAFSFEPPLAGMAIAAVGAALVREGSEGGRARWRATRALRSLELRRRLLDGLDEAVVLWGADDEPLVANRVAEEWFGAHPKRADLPPGELARDGRELVIEEIAVESGRLSIARDVTASRALERQRREMQRLVSHELKTPLASISGFGAMLGRYDLSKEELGRVAGLVRDEADRLREMVTTFLDLERLAEQDGRREAVDLARLVADRVEVLGAAAAERGQEIRFRGELGATVDGVPVLLARVVDNLIGNALKYSASGTTVEVAVDGSNGAVRLEVADHGKGIAPEHLPRLFERFYRVPGGGESGSGLGLAFVREVAEWHDGCVEVESEAGKGSVFSVTIPRRETTK